MRAMIIPGNGDTLITSNWYPYVKDGLEKLGIEVIAQNMPDPKLARKDIWVPFIKERLPDHENSILIGHSSGAAAVLRFLEENKCKLAIIMGACYTDLGDELEKKSGYFDEPWKWEQIKNNAEKIIIFASQDDPYIPISEPRFIREKTDAEYHEYKDEGHFGAVDGKKEFPEIILAVQKLFKK